MDRTSPSSCKPSMRSSRRSRRSMRSARPHSGRGWRKSRTQAVDGGRAGPREASMGTPEILQPEIVWHRLPDPDDEPDTNRILSWGKVPVGHEITGSFRGTREGKYGPVGVVELANGARQRFGLPTLLARRLSVVERGQQIKIIYL